MGSIWISFFDILLILASFMLLKRYLDRRKCSHGLSYPPGPKALPIIGNLFDIPKESQWKTYATWAKQYGDVISVTALGQVVVVVNSANAAKELFERRGKRYMNRPRNLMVELMGWDITIAFSQNSDAWRVGRKLIDHSLRSQAALSYRPLQMAKNYAFLNQLLHAPEHFRDHIKHMTAAIVMSLTYGYDVKETDDPFILLADRVNKFTLEPLLPGAFLVNTLPFLKQFPEWLPGMGFKRHARYVFELGQEMINSPFEFVKENIRKGTARPSIVRECINLHEDGNMSPLDELTVKRAIVSVYAGGVETTAAAISTLFLVLALYPSVQQRAQAELDAVVGGDRLPEYDDRSRLPFIDAICQEILRWKPIAPLGLPHAAAEDDVYDGYFIPKGATVLGNVWAILHDPDIYPDPEVFDPDRFLTPDGQVKNDPVLTSVFGFGRRICPGRHLVDSTLWIAAASLLSAFNVCKAKDEHGDEIHIEAAYTDSSPSWHPKEFACSITPRSKVKTELITSSLASDEERS